MKNWFLTVVEDSKKNFDLTGEKQHGFKQGKITIPAGLAIQ